MLSPTEDQALALLPFLRLAEMVLRLLSPVEMQWALVPPERGSDSWAGLPLPRETPNTASYQIWWEFSWRANSTWEKNLLYLSHVTMATRNYYSLKEESFSLPNNILLQNQLFWIGSFSINWQKNNVSITMVMKVYDVSLTNTLTLKWGFDCEVTKLWPIKKQK